MRAGCLARGMRGHVPLHCSRGSVSRELRQVCVRVRASVQACMHANLDPRLAPTPPHAAAATDRPTRAQSTSRCAPSPPGASSSWASSASSSSCSSLWVPRCAALRCCRMGVVWGQGQGAGMHWHAQGVRVRSVHACKCLLRAPCAAGRSALAVAHTGVQACMQACKLACRHAGTRAHTQVQTLRQTCACACTQAWLQAHTRACGCNRHECRRASSHGLTVDRLAHLHARTNPTHAQPINQIIIGS